MPEYTESHLKYAPMYRSKITELFTKEMWGTPMVQPKKNKKNPQTVPLTQENIVHASLDFDAHTPVLTLKIHVPGILVEASSKKE